MTSIRFTVPGLPQPKERPRIGKSGHVYTPKRTGAYEQVVRTYWLKAVTGTGWPLRAVEKATYALSLWMFFPDRRIRDMDNVLKSVQDAGNGFFFLDDSEVVETHMYRGLDRVSPRVEILLERKSAEKAA